jgi:hypothetical protein
MMKTIASENIPAYCLLHRDEQLMTMPPLFSISRIRFFGKAAVNQNFFWFKKDRYTLFEIVYKLQSQFRNRENGK